MNPPPAVEDPISAIFDLSDRVAQLAPTVRRMYRYTATILVLWILIMAFVTLVALGGNLTLAVLSVLGLIAGVIALSLLRETDRFFRNFVMRHRAIRLLRDADPVVRVPAGRTPIERLARYLGQASPAIESWLKEHPEALRYRAEFPGRGTPVMFELLIERPGSRLWRWLGWGDAGFAVLARMGPDAPTTADLTRLASDGQAVAARLQAAPVRLILLRMGTIPLPEDVYEWAVGRPAFLARGFSRYRVTTEIVTEGPDGTYEFVPYVLGVP
ncbi:MAG TPA: hypothetical protein VJQ43_03600 [Thermoplasmata archaeon]|nr:hypothetical protein [Thermoplasmata archaeon]